MLLSRVGASPWYIGWNKVIAPTILLCAGGCLDTIQCNHKTSLALISLGMNPSSAAHQNKRVMQLLVDKQFQS